ncbi:MAG TPA: TatD family hydrolase [Candidatus Paceibacterota bacterium]|jgi:TatD DNase family protein|nr:TatD family hydrolase [Candidatus Paceibacterota bacterium]
MKYFDAHTHVNFVAYKDDRDEVIKRAAEQGVGMNCVGTQLDTSKAAVELGRKYDNVWATIGLHPIHTSKSYHDEKELGDGGKEFTSRGESFDSSAYEELGKDPRVIAIGECGLDYYRVEGSTKDIQIKNFVAQIELANKLGKPLMLHIRNAYEDALEVIKAHAEVKGDVHFFAGDWNIAKKFLDLGFTLSFTGVITFTHDYDEVIKNAPLDMILSETDAPYVTPVPHRGKRNEPLYVEQVVKKIAEIRGIDSEEARAQIMRNSGRVFSPDKE